MEEQEIDYEAEMKNFCCPSFYSDYTVMDTMGMNIRIFKSPFEANSYCFVMTSGYGFAPHTHFWTCERYIKFCPHCGTNLANFYKNDSFINEHDWKKLTSELSRTADKKRVCEEKVKAQQTRLLELKAKRPLLQRESWQLSVLDELMVCDTAQALDLLYIKTQNQPTDKDVKESLLKSIIEKRFFY
jgi:hypothetical protein